MTGRERKVRSGAQSGWTLPWCWALIQPGMGVPWALPWTGCRVSRGHSPGRDSGSHGCFPGRGSDHPVWGCGSCRCSPGLALCVPPGASWERCHSRQTDTSPFCLSVYFSSSVPLPDFQSDYLCQNLAAKQQPMERPGRWVAFAYQSSPARCVWAPTRGGRRLRSPGKLG